VINASFETNFSMLGRALDQIEAVLIRFEPDAMEKLEEHTSFLNSITAVSLTASSKKRLSARCETLRHLLEHSQSNLAILQRTHSRRGGSTVFTHGRRSYPWQH
jgi:hypothetical protein